MLQSQKTAGYVRGEEMRNGYVLKRSNRKTVAIEISPEGVVIVKAPYGVSEQMIGELLQTKRDWIQSTLQKCERRQKRDKNYVLFRGKEYRICIKGHKSNSLKVEIQGDELIVKKPNGFALDVKSLLEHWYRKQAAAFIEESVKKYSQIMKVEYKNITIKDQKTRWGSCSSRGNLNFNYRLIMAPDEVLEYVVVHELAHRIYMDHSQAFWNQVEEILPDYKEKRLWLKEHGHELML